MDRIERTNKEERSNVIISTKQMILDQSSSKTPCERTEFLVEWRDKLFLFVYQNRGNWTRDDSFYSPCFSHQTFVGDNVSIETDGSRFPRNMVGKEKKLPISSD